MLYVEDKKIRMALCMDNMQSLSLMDIMSKSYKKGMNEMDFAVVGIRGNVYNWLVYGTVGNSVCRTWESCTLLFHVL